MFPHNPQNLCRKNAQSPRQLSRSRQPLDGQCEQEAERAAGQTGSASANHQSAVPGAAPLPAADVKAPIEVASEDKGKDKPAAGDDQPVVFKTMVIRQEVERDTRYTSPIMRITREQIELQNAQTVEEALKFMPSLQIRQRFPGDPNGVMAIRARICSQPA